MAEKGRQVGDETLVQKRRSISVRAAFLLCVITSVVTMGAVNMWPAAAANPPTRPIDRNINNYVLFALDSLHLKGGNGTTTNITDGDVGVQSDDPSDHMNLCVGGSGHSIFMGDGTQANSDNFASGPACSFWDVYSNNLTGGPVIRNSGPNTFTTPIIAPGDLPAFPSFTCNPANPVVVPKNGSQTLPPGTYGDLVVQNGATVTFGAGTYTFCGVTMGQNASIVDVDATVVQIADSLSANGGTIGPSPSAKWFVRGDDVHNSNDTAVQFGREGTIAGTFWVPDHQMNLGHGTDLTGHFWAESIDSDWNIQVHGVKPICI
jgi:hypothetical protein